MPDPFLRHLEGATVAVTGASGNLGTALLRRLTAPGSGVAEVRGLARRRPPDTAPYDGVRWYLADLGKEASDEVLPGFLDGADAVVHLAWALQPGRRPDDLRRVNVEGTGRVVRAAAAAGVAHVVHLSSLGAYAPGAVGQQVTEDWPTTGIPSAQYSRDKCRGRARRPGDRRPARRPDADRRATHPGAAARRRQRDRPLLPRAAALRGRPPAARLRGASCCRCPCRRCRSRSCTPTTSPTRSSGSWAGARPARSTSPPSR